MDEDVVVAMGLYMIIKVMHVLFTSWFHSDLFLVVGNYFYFVSILVNLQADLHLSGWLKLLHNTSIEWRASRGAFIAFSVVPPKLTGNNSFNLDTSQNPDSPLILPFTQSSI